MPQREEHKRQQHRAGADAGAHEQDVTRRDAKYGYAKGPIPPVGQHAGGDTEHETASDLAYGKGKEKGDAKKPRTRKEKVLSEFSGLETLLFLDPLKGVYFKAEDLADGAADSIPMRVQGWNVIGTIQLTSGKKIHDSYHLYAQAKAIYAQQFPPGERSESTTAVYHGTTAVYCDAIDVAKARVGIGDEDCLGGVGTHIFRNW
jgi:hypothetical protein